MDFRKRYVDFLNELSKLSRKHGELTDTDVRERLNEVLNYHFVWGKPMTGFPKRFAMMSLSADRAVAAIVKQFVLDARRLAEQEAVKVGAVRHALLEDPAAKTRRGESYDVFLGSSDEVRRAAKPSPDSIYAKASSKKKYRPAYDPQELAITVNGKKLVPSFDAESAFWKYHSGSQSMGWHQDYFRPKELRQLARDALNGKGLPLGPRKPIR
jgi:hypothetical protein